MANQISPSTWHDEKISDLVGNGCSVILVVLGHSVAPESLHKVLFFRTRRSAARTQSIYAASSATACSGFTTVISGIGRLGRGRGILDEEHPSKLHAAV